jgi:hypothetical protein
MMRAMRVMLTGMLIASSVAMLPSMSAAQSDKKVDVTGKWLFSVTTDAGTGTPTVTLKQQGDSLTGHYSSQLLGESELKGSIKEQKFTFTFRAEVQGTALVVTYAGTIDGNGSLKGTVDLGGQGTGTFTAKRQ